MEKNHSPSESTTERQNATLIHVFGEAGAEKILKQIAHDNPALSAEEVVDDAWHLIPEATAYMNPATWEDLTESAILVHEGYEALRRVQD